MSPVAGLFPFFFSAKCFSNEPTGTDSVLAVAAARSATTESDGVSSSEPVDGSELVVQPITEANATENQSDERQRFMEGTPHE
jgi:hypothetical protein